MARKSPIRSKTVAWNSAKFASGILAALQLTGAVDVGMSHAAAIAALTVALTGVVDLVLRFVSTQQLSLKEPKP